MGVFVAISDFSAEGRYSIPTNLGKTTELNNLITTYEKPIIIDMLGVELGEDVIDNPTSYDSITEPFYMQEGETIYRSEGFKTMLMGFLFFYYARQQYAELTTTGISRKKGENSTNLSFTSFDVYTRYNEGIDSYFAIQHKVKNDNITYPTYKGIDKSYVLPL